MESSVRAWENLAKYSPDLLCTLDQYGCFVYVNETWESLLGYSRAELYGRRVVDFIAPRDYWHTQQIGQAVWAGQPQVSFINHYLHKAGHEVALEWSIVWVAEEQVLFGIGRRQVVPADQLLAAQPDPYHERITDALCTLDKEWRPVYVNRKFEAILGVTRRQVLGKVIWEVFPELIGTVGEREFTAVARTGNPSHFELMFPQRNIWLDIKAFPTTGGISVYFSDITERIKTKQELEMLSLVASKTTNGVLIINAQCQTEWVNEGFTNLTGYTLAEVQGRIPNTYLPGSDTNQTTVQRISERLGQGQPFREELLIYTKTGEKVWLLLDITPVRNEANEVTRFIIIQRDITFRKKTEATYRQLAQDLQQFTYIVSHNLRAPVANVRGLTKILASTEKNCPAFDQSLAHLHTSVLAIDSVLHDLNTFLAIRDNADSVAKEEVMLATVCHQALATLQESLDACGGEVLVDMPASLCVNGKKAYVYSIFYNLLSNAIKYRSATRPLRVTVTGHHHMEGGTMVVVADNGSGFDVARAGLDVFQLYKRFHRGGEGRGLGLFLVKTQVEALGGYIAVTSQVNEGTRFVLHLK